MIRFKRHIPNAAFDSRDEPEPWLEFESVQALLASPMVSRRTQDPEFHRWSVSRGSLMAEYKGGDEHWVVGYLEGDVDLPEWVESPVAKARREAWNRGETLPPRQP